MCVLQAIQKDVQKSEKVAEEMWEKGRQESLVYRGNTERVQQQSRPIQDFPKRTLQRKESQQYVKSLDLIESHEYIQCNR